ncbi:hypothetical protein ABZ913_35190 [Streptosporangium sandarakinum]
MGWRPRRPGRRLPRPAAPPPGPGTALATVTGTAWGLWLLRAVYIDARTDPAPLDAGGRIDWDISVDSTTVRAHQHATGAPHTLPPALAPPGRQKGDAAGTNRGDPVLAMLAARLAEVVRLGNA